MTLQVRCLAIEPAAMIMPYCRHEYVMLPRNRRAHRPAYVTLHDKALHYIASRSSPLLGDGDSGAPASAVLAPCPTPREPWSAPPPSDGDST